MFEGKVKVEAFDAIWDAVGERWVEGERQSSLYQTNSITAEGLRKLLGGEMFTDGIYPRIHVYSHPETITPAVRQVSGFIETCDQLSAPSLVTTPETTTTKLTLQGRLDPPGADRTLRTVGLSGELDTSAPSFAVRLTNPVTQTTTQLVNITYEISARQDNTVSIAATGSSVNKVTNNSWSDVFTELLGGELAPLAQPATMDVLTLLNSPEDYSMASSPTATGSIALNLGSAASNRWAMDEVFGAVTPTYTVYGDEGVAQVSFELGADDGIGFPLTKALISTASGAHVYANDIGYSTTTSTPRAVAQVPYLHQPDSVRPYASYLQPFGTGVGVVNVVTPDPYAVKAPAYLAFRFLLGGDPGVATYVPMVRYAFGFYDNLCEQELSYRLPALSEREVVLDEAGSWLNTYDSSGRYTGTEIPRLSDNLEHAFSVRLSEYEDSSYIGNGQRSDAIGIPTSNSITVVSNLGTVITKIDQARFVSFNATEITNIAVVKESTANNRNRILAGCRATGLWSISESPLNGTWNPSTPQTVAVPNVDPTECYAVSGYGQWRMQGGTLRNVVFAVFDGGLVRSINGGSTWTVYSPTLTSMTAVAGLTDAWSNVVAIIPGPHDLVTGNSVVGIVTNDDSIHIYELTGAFATHRRTVTQAGLTQGPFLDQKRHICLEMHNSTIPATYTFVVQAESVGLPTLYRFPNTYGASGAAVVTAAPAQYNDVMYGVRMLEVADPSTGDVGLVVANTTNTSVDIVDETFTPLVQIPSPFIGNDLGEYRIRTTSCRPFRHFCLSTSPQIELYNPFTTDTLYDSHPAPHLVWREYTWTGSEWTLVTDGSAPAARVTHDTPQTLFSSSANGIIDDIPINLTVDFQLGEGSPQFVANEFQSFVIASSLVKDQFIELTYTSSHSFFKTARVQATPVLLGALGLVDQYVNFITTSDDSIWTSFRGTTSAGTSVAKSFARSELVTLTDSHDIAFRFRSTSASSTGAFIVGVSLTNLPDVLGIGENVEDHLPIRIQFSGDQYTVYNGAAVVAGPTNYTGTVLRIEVSKGGATFAVSDNGFVLALSDNTLPASLVNNEVAVGLYAENNQNRYVYDFTIDTWPTSAGNRAYYSLDASATPLNADPLFISVESRVAPSTSVLTIPDEQTVYYNDPSQLIAIGLDTNQIRLLPRSGIVEVNDVDEIASALLDVTVLKR